MQEIQDKDRKPPKKPLIYYYIIAMVVVLLLNALFFPSVLETKVVEVAYSDFLTMVDDGLVQEVALEESSGQLVFTAEQPDNSDKIGIYKTGIWPDDGQRLLEQLRSDPDISFSAEIPTQANPILSFIVSWVAPILFFLLIGELKKRRFEPSQAFAMNLKKEEYRACIDLSASDERVVRYLKGETLDVSDLVSAKEKGWHLVCVDGYPLGFGKLAGQTLKNKYLPGWRICG